MQGIKTRCPLKLELRNAASQMISLHYEKKNGMLTKPMKVKFEDVEEAVENAQKARLLPLIELLLRLLPEMPACTFVTGAGNVCTSG